MDWSVWLVELSINHHLGFIHTFEPTLNCQNRRSDRWTDWSNQIWMNRTTFFCFLIFKTTSFWFILHQKQHCFAPHTHPLLYVLMSIATPPSNTSSFLFLPTDDPIPMAIIWMNYFKDKNLKISIIYRSMLLIENTNYVPIICIEVY